MAELNGRAGPRPVFIIGSLRSGVSLVSLALAQHPQMGAVMENPWLEEFAVGLIRSYRAACENRATSQIDINGLELEEFFAHFGPSAIRLMTGTSPGNAIVLDSTPSSIFLAAPLRLLFPDAKFIHVVRDVQEVVSTLTNTELGSVYKSRHILCSEAQAYDHWLRAVNAGVAAERAFGSDVVLRVWRETLIARPAETLQRCTDFLGVPFNAACLRPFSSISTMLDTRPNGRPPARTVGKNTQSTASTLSALLATGTIAFPSDEVAADRLRAEMWQKTMRSQRLVPPIPGSAAAVRAQRKQVREGKIASQSSGVNRLGRLVERLRGGLAS